MITLTKVKAKKLTLQEIAKQDSKFNERKKIKLLGKYDVEIDRFFRKSKVQLLLANYLTILTDLQKRENVTTETILNSSSLLHALVIKYFSDIELPSVESVEDLIIVSTALIDLNIVDELFNGDGFDKEEIEKLTNEINKSAKLIGEKIGEMAVQSTLNEVEGDA